MLRESDRLTRWRRLSLPIIFSSDFCAQISVLMKEFKCRTAEKRARIQLSVSMFASQLLLSLKHDSIIPGSFKSARVIVIMSLIGVL